MEGNWLDLSTTTRIALDAGLVQPDDVRATLDQGPAARQEVLTTGSLWSVESMSNIHHHQLDREI